uniref:E3 ubiquitin-protein ligase RFWD2 n=1 Tax=Tetraselmis sp. GSL018 TaxID=582737 RepID=A0A061R0K9_9CHLO|eukprot:CAMPEP_0177608866 /NCGR_PEP_ID=MMETSP0419_2-20121207/18723_1 /TAXON_ID=582737 /ORGANISM="Tetraselmis sp., Strain GSL018" /LENGTH=1034 /DNA_ID=CAMNT_0019103631 /DNA_START=393 /DNA_END=3497 /DNA_ORIENTATION=+
MCMLTKEKFARFPEGNGFAGLHRGASADTQRRVKEGAVGRVEMYTGSSPQGQDNRSEFQVTISNNYNYATEEEVVCQSSSTVKPDLQDSQRIRNCLPTEKQTWGAGAPSGFTCPCCPEDCTVIVADFHNNSQREQVVTSLRACGYRVRDEICPPAESLQFAGHLSSEGFACNVDIIVAPLEEDWLIRLEAALAGDDAFPLAAAVVCCDTLGLLKNRPQLLAEALRRGAADVIELTDDKRVYDTLWKHALRQQRSRVELHRKRKAASLIQPDPQRRKQSPPQSATSDSPPSQEDLDACNKSSVGVPSTLHPAVVTGPGQSSDAACPAMPLSQWAESNLTRVGSCVASRRQQVSQVFLQLVLRVKEHHDTHNTVLGPRELLGRFAVSPDCNVTEMQLPDAADPGGPALPLPPEGPSNATSSDVFLLGQLLFQMLRLLLGPPPPCDWGIAPGPRLADTVLRRWPAEGALILAMTHPDPQRRPSLAEVAAHPALGPGPLGWSPEAPPLLERAQALDLGRARGAADAVLAFLRAMRSRLQEAHAAGSSQREVLDADCASVLSVLQGSTQAAPPEAPPAQSPDGDAPSGASDLLRRPRRAPTLVRQGLDMFACLEPEGAESPGSSAQTGSEEPPPGAPLDRWERLESQLPAMESMYLQRCRGTSDAPEPPTGPRRRFEEAGLSPHLAAFACDLHSFSRYGALTVHASLVQGSAVVGGSGAGSAGNNHVIAGLAFGCQDEMFATAGAATRKVKLYQVQPLLRHHADSLCRRASAAHYPLLEFEAQHRLSSLSWNQYIRNYLATADHGGTVQLWDASRGDPITTFRHHTKRVWSVHCSMLDPKRLLSAGDDGAARVWSASEAGASHVIATASPIYSAQFSPGNLNHVAVGCANYSAYLFDLRNASRPVKSLGGHSKPVSYVRFVGSDRLATASIDSTVRLWDVADGGGGGGPRCTFREHVNDKCFVGLDARDDGYILCGSETNQVHCYFAPLPVPILRHTFAGGGCGARKPTASSVCWSASGNLFLAANTSGIVDLLEMSPA